MAAVLDSTTPFCDLPPLVQAEQIRRLTREGMNPVADTAQRVGIAPWRAEELLELLSFPEHIRAQLADDTISEAKARDLARRYTAERKLGGQSTNPAAPAPEPTIPTVAAFHTMDPIAQARVLGWMRDEERGLGLPWREVAARLSITTGVGHQTLSLLKLDEDIQSLVERREIVPHRARMMQRERALKREEPTSVAASSRDPDPAPAPVLVVPIIAAIEAEPEPDEPHRTAVELPAPRPAAAVVHHWLDDLTPAVASGDDVQPGAFLTYSRALLDLAQARTVDDAICSGAQALVALAHCRQAGHVGRDEADGFARELAAALHLTVPQLVDLATLQEQARHADVAESRAAYQRVLEAARKQVEA